MYSRKTVVRPHLSKVSKTIETFDTICWAIGSITETSGMASSPQRTARHEYADEIGLYYEERGLPRIAGRILGWLLVCEPPQQSADQLAAELGVSRGSVSMSMKLLRANEVIEIVAFPGDRRTYYRLRPGFWLEEASQKARQAAEWVKVAERGLDLLADSPPESRRRLHEAREMYSFLAEQYARIEVLWHERQANASDRP